MAAVSESYLVIRDKGAKNHRTDIQKNLPTFLPPLEFFAIVECACVYLDRKRKVSSLEFFWTIAAAAATQE